MNNLTVVILAAGLGKRMGAFSNMINKSLVPFDNRPIISHIMDRFPNDTKFIIACGHYGNQIKTYLRNVLPEKNVQYIEIDNYDEQSTGPATSLRKCAKNIDGSFFWITCDTLFDFDYSDKLNENWIAVSSVSHELAKDYLWVEQSNNRIESYHNKELSYKPVDAFIGLMHLIDKKFIDNLESKDAKEMFEGFENLDIKVYNVDKWQDFGTYEKWKSIAETLPEVSFPKPNEVFYSENGKVAKFTCDRVHAKQRYLRAIINPKCIPNNVTHEDNFLFYDRVIGDTLYTHLSLENFKLFLKWAEDILWVKRRKETTVTNIPTIANKFYRTKTFDRLADFRSKYPYWKDPYTVNGVEVKSVDEYLASINFGFMSSETNWRYIHGDLQFDNIIFTPETKKFTAIDWRTDFGGDYYGDLYYDLAKMLGGIYLSYKNVKEDKLEYNEHEGNVNISICAVDNASDYVTLLEEFTLRKGLSWRKVQELVPIIYLNMSPLHDAPFDKYLIALSQLHFAAL